MFHQTQRTLNVFLRDTNTYPSATLAFDYSIYDLGVVTTGACKVSSVSSLSGYTKIGDLTKQDNPTSGIEAKLNSEFAVTTAGNHGYYLYSPSRGLGLQIYIEIQTVNGAGTYDDTKRTLSFFNTTHSVFSNGGADNNAGNNHYIDTTAPTISSISASTSGCHDYSSTAGYYCNAGDKITFTVAANEGEAREAVVAISFAGDSKTIAISQAAKPAEGGSEPVTVSLTMADLGYANQTSVKDKEIKVDDNVTLVFKQGSAGTPPTYYTSGEAIRMYQNGATLDVTANGKTITAVKFTFASNMN